MAKKKPLAWVGRKGRKETAEMLVEEFARRIRLSHAGSIEKVSITGDELKHFQKVPFSTTTAQKLSKLQRRVMVGFNQRRIDFETVNVSRRVVNGEMVAIDVTLKRDVPISVRYHSP